MLFFKKNTSKCIVATHQIQTTRHQNSTTCQKVVTTHWKCVARALEHADMLKEHTDGLKEHADVLNEHADVLKEHAEQRVKRTRQGKVLFLKNMPTCCTAGWWWNHTIYGKPRVSFKTSQHFFNSPQSNSYEPSLCSSPLRARASDVYELSNSLKFPVREEVSAQRGQN